MPAHGKSRDPEYRALQSRRAMGNRNGVDALRAASERRRVQFDEGMRQAMMSEYKRRRSVEYMAAHIGVSRGVMQRELRAANLPVGRWVPRA